MRTSLRFSIADRIGSLDQVLRVIAANNASLSRIESRPSTTADWDYDFFIDMRVTDQRALDKLVEELKPIVKQVKVIGAGLKGKHGEQEHHVSKGFI